MVKKINNRKKLESRRVEIPPKNEKLVNSSERTHLAPYPHRIQSTTDSYNKGMRDLSCLVDCAKFNIK